MHANNFKIDEKYKQMVQKGASSIAESIREAKLNQQKKREAKLDQKIKKKAALDLNALL